MITRHEKYLQKADERFEMQHKLSEEQYSFLSDKLRNNTARLKELEQKLADSKQFICYDLECKIRKGKR